MGLLFSGKKMGLLFSSKKMFSGKKDGGFWVRIRKLICIFSCKFSYGGVKDLSTETTYLDSLILVRSIIDKNVFICRYVGDSDRNDCDYSIKGMPKVIWKDVYIP